VAQTSRNICLNPLSPVLPFRIKVIAVVGEDRTSPEVFPPPVHDLLPVCARPDRLQGDEHSPDVDKHASRVNERKGQTWLGWREGFFSIHEKLGMG